MNAKEQAHQRTVHIEVRNGLALGDQRRDALKTAQQRHQRRLHFENNPRSKRGDERYVTAAHQRVAQSLLGVDEDCLVADVVIAGPERLAEIASRVALRLTDHRYSLVKGGKRFIVAMQAPTHIAAAKPCARQIRIDRQCLFKGGKSSVVALQIEQDVTAAEPGIRRIGCDRQCRVISGAGFAVTLQAPQHIAAADPDVGQIGL
ncbi:MAG: hypothetical protein WBF47_13725, partial [Xanthobacteraceae bacterium]